MINPEHKLPAALLPSGSIEVIDNPIKIEKKTIILEYTPQATTERAIRRLIQEARIQPVGTADQFLFEEVEGEKKHAALSEVMRRTPDHTLRVIPANIQLEVDAFNDAAYSAMIKEGMLLNEFEDDGTELKIPGGMTVKTAIYKNKLYPNLVYPAKRYFAANGSILYTDWYARKVRKEPKNEFNSNSESTDVKYGIY